MKLWSTTEWRQGIKGEVIASCPLKDGRTSCGGPEDRLLEAKTGGWGGTNREGAMWKLGSHGSQKEKLPFPTF